MREQQKRELSTFGKLARQSVEDNKKWIENGACAYSVSHHTLCLAEDVGKFASIVKNIEREALDARDAKVRLSLQMELTKVFTDVLVIAGLMGFDLERSYHMVRQANEQAYNAARERVKGTVKK